MRFPPGLPDCFGRVGSRGCCGLEGAEGVEDLSALGGDRDTQVVNPALLDGYLPKGSIRATGIDSHTNRAGARVGIGRLSPRGVFEEVDSSVEESDDLCTSDRPVWTEEPFAHSRSYSVYEGPAYFSVCLMFPGNIIKEVGSSTETVG